MANPDIKQKPTVTVRFERGMASHAQKQVWQHFWQKLIWTAKNDARQE